MVRSEWVELENGWIVEESVKDGRLLVCVKNDDGDPVELVGLPETDDGFLVLRFTTARIEDGHQDLQPVV